MKHLRHVSFVYLHKRDGIGKAALTVRAALGALITVNVICVILESVKEYEAAYHPVFLAVEYFSIGVFVFEYLLRVWSCIEVEGYRGGVLGRLRYMFSLFAVIDLLAILPAFLPWLIPYDLRILRGLRLMRLVRVLKLGEYSTSLALFAQVFRKKRSDLIVALAVVALVVVVTSSLVCYFENEAQPLAFSSIPAAIWWGFATLTTIGYGDVYPVTIAGKTCAAAIALFSISLVALPSGIIVSGFVEEVDKKKKGVGTCPHCGKVLI